MSKIIPPRLLMHPLHCLSLGFGSGLAPRAPGTFGSLVGVLLYLPLSLLPVFGYLLLTVLAFLAGIWLCHKTAAALGVHDHPGIVWDEIVGIWVSFILIPAGWVWLLIGFLLFRVFDILKPWPIKWVDKKVDGGLGIMLDDLLAGIFTLICIQIFSYLLYS